MADPTPLRRSTDNLEDDIEALILQENDPKQRAFLIVLNSINKSLVANTATIREVSDKLETHLQHFEDHSKTEEALMNKGRGVWMVAAWVIGIVQLVGLGIWQGARADIAEISTTIADNKTKIVEVMVRINQLEKGK